MKAQRLEGLVAERADSKYELGMRLSLGQALQSVKNFDALVIAYYEDPTWLLAPRFAARFLNNRVRALF